jgi:hypothetical protein
LTIALNLLKKIVWILEMMFNLHIDDITTKVIEEKDINEKDI